MSPQSPRRHSGQSSSASLAAAALFSLLPSPSSSSSSSQSASQPTRRATRGASSSSPLLAAAVACSACLLLHAASSSLPSLGAEARSIALPSPQCHPDVLKTMKPRIKQICKALEAIWQFSDVMENYLDDKALEDEQGLEELASYPALTAAERPFPNTGVKRKGDEKDHVFLRFGKRTLFRPA